MISRGRFVLFVALAASAFTASTATAATPAPRLIAPGALYNYTPGAQFFLTVPRLPAGWYYRLQLRRLSACNLPALALGPIVRPRVYAPGQIQVIWRKPASDWCRAIIGLGEWQLVQVRGATKIIRARQRVQFRQGLYRP